MLGRSSVQAGRDTIDFCKRGRTERGHALEGRRAGGTAAKGERGQIAVKVHRSDPTLAEYLESTGRTCEQALPFTSLGRSKFRMSAVSCILERICHFSAPESKD
jgi:hypothetical protein